jgi:hypothetical protein
MLESPPKQPVASPTANPLCHPFVAEVTRFLAPLAIEIQIEAIHSFFDSKINVHASHMLKYRTPFHKNTRNQCTRISHAEIPYKKYITTSDLCFLGVAVGCYSGNGGLLY